MVTNYLAYVYEVVDRNVKVYSDVIPRSNNLVKPLQDGLSKQEVPAVDDLVLVLDMDSSHAIRFYTPIRKEFAILADDPANTQIESSGKVQITAADMVELGGSSSPPTDFIALATNTENRLAALESAMNTHVHGGVTAGAAATLVATPPVVLNTPPAPVAATKVKAL